MEVRIDQNVLKNAPRKSIRISIPKVSQKGGKWSPKRSQNRIKKSLKFRLAFVSFFLKLRVPSGLVIWGSAGGWSTLWAAGKTSKIKKIIDFVWEGCKFGNIAFWYPSKKLF